jgi:threonine dehydrogenase-like Zn-dependent dehydrogenase
MSSAAGDLGHPRGGHGGARPAGGKLAHRVAKMPDAIAAPMSATMGIDRLGALHAAIALVQRGDTVSLSGVYGGAASPMPLLQMFDKQITLRMGQANVRHWVDHITPRVCDDDEPLGVEDFVTHHVALHEAPQAHEAFQEEDGALKVLLQP